MRTRGNKDRCTMIKKMGIRERMERVRKTERKKRIQQADIETQRNTDRTNGVEAETEDGDAGRDLRVRRRWPRPSHRDLKKTSRAN